MSYTYHISGKLTDLANVTDFMKKCIVKMFPYATDNSEKITRIAKEYEEFNNNSTIEWIIIKLNNEIIATVFHLEGRSAKRLCHMMADSNDSRQVMVKYISENIKNFYTYIHKTNKLKDFYVSLGMVAETEFEPEHDRDPKDGWIKLVKN